VAVAEAADGRAALSALQAGLDEAGQRRVTVRQELSDAQEKLESSEKEAKQNRRALNDAKEEAQAVQNMIQGHSLRMDSRRQKAEDAQAQKLDLTMKVRAQDDRIRLLTEMEKEYEGFNKAVKTVMQASEKSTLRGVHGPVAGLMTTKQEYAVALETALGAALQNIVVDREEDAKTAIQFLKQRDGGRATFLPLTAIRGDVLRENIAGEYGFVGVASELVRYDSRYDGIFKNLLGRTAVMEDLDSGIALARKFRNAFRIVTLDGQLINAGGSMTGGSSAKGTGIISRANELEKLRKQREKLAENEKSYTQQLERAKTDLAAVRYQLDMKLEEQAEIKSRISSLEAEKRAVESSAAQLKLLLESLTGDSQARREAVEAYQRKIDSFNERLKEKEAEIAAINEKAKAIKNDIAEISRSKMELEGKRTRADKEAQERNGDILDLERKVAKIEQKKLAADMEEKQIMDKLWENYELSHTAAQAMRQPVESLPKANKLIGELRRQINSLGTPNLGAIEEYDRVSERYGFLSGQRDDVTKAKSELVGIIKEITSQMEEVFVERFKEIDECFRQTFLELFGGGKAALRLEDENDVLNCGIEIKVQPPGKALTNLSLLSGGEMAFVAIALYFAILKVRPTPFCVMDEIEAALDEANVTRYAEYMRRMSDKTQFLVITHRRGTMEEADMLYGVTMQEKGVSTVIELDLEDAQKTITQ